MQQLKGDSALQQRRKNLQAYAVAGIAIRRIA
jgi:hypothetical protein